MLIGGSPWNMTNTIRIDNNCVSCNAFIQKSEYGQELSLAPEGFEPTYIVILQNYYIQKLFLIISFRFSALKENGSRNSQE